MLGAIRPRFIPKRPAPAIGISTIIVTSHAPMEKMMPRHQNPFAAAPGIAAKSRPQAPVPIMKCMIRPTVCDPPPTILPIIWIGSGSGMIPIRPFTNMMAERTTVATKPAAMPFQ